MKIKLLPILITFLFLSWVSPGTAAPSESREILSKEFQNFPPVDIQKMTDYDWAVIRQILNRAADLSNVKYWTPPRFFNGTITIIVEGPAYQDDYLHRFAGQFSSMTNDLLTVIGPFFTSVAPLHFDMSPKNSHLIVSPATAIFEASYLKPQFHAGKTISFPDVWAASVNRLGTIQGLEVDGQTEARDKFPWSIKTNWAKAKYELPGFVAREQIALRLHSWMSGQSMTLSVDSTIQIRRLSSSDWMTFTLDPSTLSVIRPRSRETTQDICLAELSEELRK